MSALFIKRTLADKENLPTLFPQHASKNSNPLPHPGQHLTVASYAIDALLRPQSTRKRKQPSASPTSPRLKNAEAAISRPVKRITIPEMEQEFKRQHSKLLFLRQIASDTKQTARKADARANEIAALALKQESFVHNVVGWMNQTSDDDKILVLTQHFETHERHRSAIRGIRNKAEMVECTWKGPTKPIPVSEMELAFKHQFSQLLNLRNAASKATLAARQVESNANETLGRTLKQERLVHHYVSVMAKMSYSDKTLALAQHSESQKNTMTALTDAQNEISHTETEIRKWIAFLFSQKY
jgi:hypothetical protein